jgi:gamma-glutamyltranspeptidase/glutathione hydrolase
LDADFGRGSTSLAAVDREGGMVACAFTMGAPFGTARMIPGTGILLGDADAAGASPLAIMMLINRPTKTARMTAVAAHGPAAGGASKAIGTPRAVPSPSHETIFVDDDGGALIERLKSVGLTAERAGTLGLINLVACPTASRRGPQICDVRADPRGHGISASVE